MKQSPSAIQIIGILAVLFAWVQWLLDVFMKHQPVGQACLSAVIVIIIGLAMLFLGDNS